MRSSSTMSALYDEPDSPDPLASSTNSNSDELSQSTRIASPSARRKQTMSRPSLGSVPSLPPSSPSRTITEQTLSPWRIRVTVEAEHEDQKEGMIRTTTRTVKVPLKEESSSVGTGTGQITRSGRGSTPNVRQRSRTPTSRRRRQSVTDLDIVVLGDDADEDEWGKKSKRSSPKKNNSRKKAPKQIADDATSCGTADFEVRQDTDVEDGDNTHDRDDSPELRQIDLNRVSIRSRANSTKQKAHLSDAVSGDFQGEVSRPLPKGLSDPRRTFSANSVMTYPTPSPTASERGQSVEAEIEDSHEKDHAEGFDTIMESEGFTMIDLDTIPSVKQMLSSPSEDQNSTSSGQVRSPTAESSGSVRRHAPFPAHEPTVSEIKPLRALPPHIILPEGESDISSTVPSSPPAFEPRPQVMRQKTPLSFLQVPAQPRNRIVTPQPYSSPKLPSPPKPTPLKDRSTPDSAKAMRAGLALLGAIEPVGLYPVLPAHDDVDTKDARHTRSSSDELFEGYDSSMKRELRAGLRFGEELGKRQAAKNLAYTPELGQNLGNPGQIWRGESVISRTPVQTVQEQIQKKRLSTSQLDSAPVVNSTPHAPLRTEPQHPNTEARRESEWELERRAVSKQIEEASPDKVIVINSDDEDDQTDLEQGPNDSLEDETMGDDEDIWLDEAKDSSSSPRQERDISTTSDPPERTSQLNVTHDAVDNPRRSLIPSPWRRGEQLDEANNSTIITNGDDMSGLLWKLPQGQEDTRFGATAINHLRKELKESGEAGLAARRTSGAFDIEKMLGTPKRIRESLENVNSQHTSRDAVRQNVSRDKHGLVDEDIDESVEEGVDEDHEEDGSLESAESRESSSTDEVQKPIMQVKFNDRDSAQSQTTPPQSGKSRVILPPSVARPPTPRSAMKGTRQSFGANTEEMDQAARRVIFAQRSKGVNVDWVESSSSVQLSTEDGVSSPIVEHQKHQEERHQAQVSSSQLITEDQIPHMKEKVRDEAQDQEQKVSQKGWFGWFKKDNRPAASGDQNLSIPRIQTDGTSERLESRMEGEPKIDQEWLPTSRHSEAQNPTVDQTSRSSKSRNQSTKSKSKDLHLPSYLQPPSYPSDPLRPINSILSTSGHFTNTHFRTLHILHRKSQRPRFHAPPLSSCRPEIRNLVSQKWKLNVDESASGMGAFGWTVGELEARVLERFCREVEISSLHAKGWSEKEIEGEVAGWLGGAGIWGGNSNHGAGDVRWGWMVTELATWLGRIVVGEVVRDEEYTRAA